MINELITHIKSNLSFHFLKLFVLKFYYFTTFDIN